MIPFSIYALKVILISGFLFGYYYLVLRNERFHEWNRYYLILSVLISLALPFARWSALFSGYGGSRRIYVAELQNFTITASAHTPSSTGWDWVTWSAFIYGFVALIFMTGLISGMLKIRSRILQGEKRRFAIFTLVSHPKIESPFSFFRFIFWNDLFAIDTPEGNHIFKHELAHVKEKHSVDKLLMEVILALLWMNPFFYLIRKELHLIHEFIADRRACHDNSDIESPGYLSPQDYAALLVKQCMRTYHTGGANYFFHKQLKRRVRMIVRNNRPHFTYIKRMMAVPLMLAVALFFVVLQSEAKENNIQPLKNVSHILQKTQDAIKEMLPEKVVQVTSNSPHEGINSSQIVKVPEPVQPQLKSIYLSNIANHRNAALVDVGVSPANKVFKFVEQMPSFPGREDALMRYLSSHIHYPAAARENGIQGTVVVQFNVNPDGHLSDVTTVSRRLGGGLDAEAVRMVKNMPDWIAGKQNGRKVTVQYSLPVRFVLRGNNDPVQSQNEPPPSQSFTENTNNTSGNVFKFVQQMPSFPGGENALMKFLQTHIHYPAAARENGIQGTVVVRFVVQTDGHLSNITAINPAMRGGLEQEAMRVVKEMPAWNPGMQDGQKVNVEYSLPVRFVLQ